MILDRYLFREWLKTFLLSSVAIIGLLLLSEIYKDLFDFVEKGESLTTIVFYFSLLIPGYVPILLPITFLISLLFCLGNLQKNSEVVAMRAAGISLLRLSRPFWLGATLLALLLLWLNASLVPSSMETARDLLESVEKEEFEDGSINMDFRARALGVRIPGKEPLWFVEAYDRNEQIAYGFTYFQMEEGRETGRITAARAHYLPEEGIWRLHSGYILQNEEESTLPESVQMFEVTDLRETGLTPDLLMGLSRRPKDMSLRELGRLIQYDGGKDANLNPYAVQYYSTLTSPIQFFVILLLTLPVALGSGRIKPSAGVARAVWCFMVFMLLISLFKFAGDRGLIAPLISTVVPMLIAFAFGCYLFRRNA